ncbi:hypothetical protein Bca4012_054580 [Brassica carinata]
MLHVQRLRRHVVTKSSKVCVIVDLVVALVIRVMPKRNCFQKGHSFDSAIGGGTDELVIGKATMIINEATWIASS